MSEEIEVVRKTLDLSWYEYDEAEKKHIQMWVDSLLEVGGNLGPMVGFPMEWYPEGGHGESEPLNVLEPLIIRLEMCDEEIVININIREMIVRSLADNSDGSYCKGLRKMADAFIELGRTMNETIKSEAT